MRCVVWHAPPDAEPVTVAGTQAAVVLQLGTLDALQAGSDTTTCQTAYVQRFIVACQLYIAVIHTCLLDSDAIVMLNGLTLINGIITHPPGGMVKMGIKLYLTVIADTLIPLNG